MKQRKRENGFSLIELLIAVSLIALTLLTVSALISLIYNGMAMVQRKRDSGNYAVELAMALKARMRVSQAEGGAFSVDSVSGLPIRNSSGEVDLRCSELFCDRIVIIPGKGVGVSPREEVVGWQEDLPRDATVKFIRAWTLTDEDAVRNWRRVSVALFPPDSNIPATFAVTGGVIK